jgi:S1-C subfamily serine protease
MKILQTLVLLAASSWSVLALGAECRESVFPLRLMDKAGVASEGFGAAVLIDEKRWVYATPANVVADADRIFVVSLVEMRVLYVDPQSHVALLVPKDLETMKIWSGFLPHKVRAVELAPGSPSTGNAQVCIYPLRSLSAERTRVVSGLEPGPLDSEGLMLLDRSIQVGESGGAVLDAHHRLIGMVVTLLGQGGTPVYPSLAIPVEKLRQAMISAFEPALRAKVSVPSGAPSTQARR